MVKAPQIIEGDLYGGSRTFTWLAELSDLSIDVVNFIICQISALFLASLFRSVLHPSKVASSVRHIVALSVGLLFGYFCFGPQAIHIAGLPAACYIVIRIQSPRVVQRGVMMVAMAYLLTIHLLRQVYDNDAHTLDITGPLMIITQKVTSLAFSIHDGFMKQTKDLTKAQQYHAINKVPSALEYFSFALHFHGLLAGPLVFYKDYIDFVEGYNLLKASNTNGNIDSVKSHFMLEPSPVKPVVKKAISSFICAFIFVKFSKMYPVKTMKDEDFITSTSIVYKMWYTMMATTCIRFKYYHAWLLADAICNNSGLGFTGYDKDGNANWDLISNINVLGFEFATNMRDAINNWNCGTNRWLRTIVYERVPKQYNTFLTFALSAVWHGFYPGYYLTFATGALMVTSARVARRMFRHRFQQTRMTRMFYDIMTCLTTRVIMGYATFPFVLLEFTGSIRLYLKFYLCLHTVALITIFILPKYICGEGRPFSPQASSETLNVEEKKSLKHNHFTKEDIEKSTLVNGNAAIIVTNLYNSTILSKDGKTKFSQRHASVPKIPLANIRREAVSIPHDQCEMDQLSCKLKEKIEAETKNIEDFIDKTVTETVSGIVEFKNDLMREPSSLRKRASISTTVVDVKTGSTGKALADESATFLKKEIEVINAVVQQANVLPAVLSNSQAK